MAESNIKNNNTEDLFYNMYHLHPVDNNGNRRQNGDTDDYRCEPFNNEITKGWYYARKYVLDKLESEKKMGIGRCHAFLKQPCTYSDTL